MSNTIYNNEYSLASGHVVTTSAISGDGSNSPLDLVNTNKVLYENYDFNTNLVTNMTFNENPYNFAATEFTFILEGTTQAFPEYSTQVVDMDALKAANRNDVTFLNTFVVTSNNGYRMRLYKGNITTAGINYISATQWVGSGALTGINNCMHVYKVVGINRISGNP